MSSITVASACTELTGLDTILAALGKAGYESRFRLLAYGRGKLRQNPPDEDTLENLAQEVEAQDGDLKELGETLRDRLVEILLAVDATPAPQAGKAPVENNVDGKKRRRQEEEAKAVAMYKGAQLCTMYSVPARHQLDAEVVIGLSENLDAGMLAAKHYRLSDLKGAMATTESKTTDLGDGLVLSADAPVSVTLSRIGDVVLQIWRFLQAVQAAGCRPIQPGPANMQAGTGGAHGDFECELPDGTAGTVRWHVTPEQPAQYFVHVVEMSSKLTCAELKNAHELFMGKVSERMVTANYNLESAIADVLDRYSLRGLLNQTGVYPTSTEDGPPNTAAKPKGRGRFEDKDKGGEGDTAHVRDLKRQIEDLRNKKGVGGKGLCDAFNGSGSGCRQPASRCRFLHKCALCGSEEHGKATCPKAGRR